MIVETFVSDVRYGLRQLRKSPAFTLTAVVTLAVGIGANLIVFGIAKAIFWQPIPVPHPEQLVAIYSRAQQGQGYYSGVAHKEFEYYHDRNDVLSSFAAYLRIPFHMRIGDVTESAIGEVVTPEFFAVLPVKTVLGRTLLTSSGAAAAPEIVLSYNVWQNRFEGRRDVLGTVVRLDGTPFTVVGVVEPDFSSVLMDWQQPPHFWVGMSALARTPFASLLTNWKANSLMVVGRMKADVNIDAVAAQFKALDTRMSQDEPDRLRAWSGKYDFQTTVLPIQRARFFPAYRESITSYVAAVAVVMGMVLLIACLNLANLTIARTGARRREWAVRSALGAGRLRLVRQSAIETALLCSVGALGGLFIASWAWRVLPLYGRPFRVVLPLDFKLDPALLLVTVALTLITGTVFGVWPCLRTSRIDVNTFLKHQPRTEKIAGIRVRSILLAGQIAVSVILLVGAGLFVRTVMNARVAEELSDTAHVGLIEIDPYGSDIANERIPFFLRDVLERVRAIPGMNSAGYYAAITGGRVFANVSTDAAASNSPPTIAADIRIASAGYFNAVGIPILHGRDFSDTDSAGSAAVAIVNEKLAKMGWPDANPIGRRLTLGMETLQVVGIVKDTKTRGFRSAIEPTVYQSFFQDSRPAGALYIRTLADPALSFAAVRDVVRELSPSVVVTARTRDQQIDGNLSQERLSATLCVALGGVALGLSLIGLYGIVTLAVSSRTKEIGIRMAVGARATDILNLVLRQSVIVVGAGVALGVSLAIALTRFISAMLYEVSALDLLSFAAAAILLMGFASIAVFIPARRATRIDAWSALRTSE
jgi:predicted permease